MLKRCWRLGVAVILMTVGSAHLSHAQEQLTLTILNQGKPPAVSVEISAYINGAKQRLTQTDASGTVSFDLNVLNLGKGTRVDVYVTRCQDGRVEILLVPEGEDDPCVDEDAVEREECGCEKIGFFIWTGGTVVIDIGTGTVTQAEEPAGPAREPPGLTIGFKVDATSLSKLEDIACGQQGISQCQVDGNIAMYGPLIEVRLGNSPLVLGAAGFYGTTSINQAYNTASDPRLPTTVDGNMTLWSVDVYGRADWWANPWLAPYLQLGASWIRNEWESVSTFPSETVSEERSQSGWRFNGGVGLDLRPLKALGLRVNLNYVSGGSNDADRQVRFGGGILLLVL